MPEPTTTPTNAPEPTPVEKPRCRMITTNGHRCKNDALYEGHLCWPHQHHRHPVLPHPTHVVVPLLEDHAAVQLVLSEVVHGLLSQKLDPEGARALIYACQVATATMPRPPRLPSPEPTQPTGTDPNQKSAEGGSAPEGESAAEGQSPRPVASGPWPVDDDDDMVYRLGLDDQGLVCADGEPPAPNARWSPALPTASPIDIIHVAPNQSKPTPRDPEDADTHRCDCPICYEIKKMKGDPMNHPHLQPVVNPYCKRNRAGCEGPGSPTQCSYCEGIYKLAPRKYARVRHTARVPHPWPGTEEPTVRLPGVGSWDDKPSGVGSGRDRKRMETREDKVELLPNPLPDQFPDNDPMLRGRIDLNAAADPALPAPRPQLQATGWQEGNTLRVLPSNPFPMKQTIPTAAGGYPH